MRGCSLSVALERKIKLVAFGNALAATEPAVKNAARRMVWEVKLPVLHIHLIRCCEIFLRQPSSLCLFCFWCGASVNGKRNFAPYVFRLFVKLIPHVRITIH